MKQGKRDILLSFIVTIQLVIVTVQLILPLLGIMTVEKAATFRVIITLLTFIPGIFVVFFKCPKRIFLSFIIYFIFLIFQFVFFPESHRFIESSAVYTLTPISILTIIFLASIDNYNYFIKTLLYVSRITLFVALVYVAAFNLSPLRVMEESYSMSFGYSMLLPAMFLFGQEKMVDKLSSVVLFFLILFGGSRGPAVVLVVFYTLDLLMFMPSRHRGRLVVFSVLILLFIILVLPNYLDFESSRTFVLLTSGELISHDGGRVDDLYSVVVPHIFERPIIGWGVGSDRFFLNGSYCHNVFYEIFLHYGIIGGLIIFLFFFGWLFKTFFSPQLKCLKEGRIMFLMMFLYGFVPLMASNSYLIFYNTAIMIGYMFWLNGFIKRRVRCKLDVSSRIK